MGCSAQPPRLPAPVWPGPGRPCRSVLCRSRLVDSCDADRTPSPRRAAGVRLTPSGEWKVYAPHRVADAFGLVLRPNPRQAPRHVYEAKVARWTRDWPELTALPWL
ncbi:nucleotidyltransferase family protein [Nonomuraea sp. NPDC049784]|uniref:nucleotidyltransferase family protein n=1 Tax=Nonomuraea sp. NPDC049784 TaxID=3154361 RepID=UPI0033D952B4